MIEVGELVKTELRFGDLSKHGVQSWAKLWVGRSGVGLRTYGANGSRSQSRGWSWRAMEEGLRVAGWGSVLP